MSLLGTRKDCVENQMITNDKYAIVINNENWKTPFSDDGCKPITCWAFWSSITQYNYTGRCEDITSCKKTSV